MTIIQVRDLSFTYAGSSKPALKNVNISVEKGEFVLVVGPSGGGKSTLLRCLNGLIPQFYEGEYSGKVFVDGLEPDKTPTYMMSQVIGMVFQNPQNQLFALSVEADIAFPLENLGLPRDEIIQRVEEAMELLNITHLRDRSPFELSGGQQQRVAIASVLAIKPKILAMDEPTSFLDPLTAAQLLSIIDDVRKRLQLTVLLVEHRVELAAAKADRIVVVSDGCVVFDGSPRDFFEFYDSHLYGVSSPKVTSLSKRLKTHLEKWNRVCLSAEEFEAEVRSLVSHL